MKIFVTKSRLWPSFLEFNCLDLILSITTSTLFLLMCAALSRFWTQVRRNCETKINQWNDRHRHICIRQSSNQLGQVENNSGLLGMRATGLTLSEEPMTMSRSHSSLSAAILLWKCSGKPSPKKTISGFMTAFWWVGEHLGQRGIT